MLTESTVFSKNSLEMRHNECFALRSGLDGLLDVARKTFLQSVEDIYKLAEKYAMELDAPVKVCFNSNRGYHIAVPSDLQSLPKEYVQAVLNKRTISCTTEELSSLSDRAAEAIDYALRLTHDLIQGLMEKVRESMDALFALTDTVALIDMLCSFADLVALSPLPFTRPLLKTDGPLVVHSGRHPVVSVLQKTGFVANDCFLGEPPHPSMLVVSGPNGSGKSTYIKQVALITIMAQIGCFVTAKYASVPVRDRILSRMCSSDDMEHNLSTFHMEMKETAYLLNNVTSRSLVLVDELGRGTSNIDGMAIAVAVAEALLYSQAFTLYVTHYSQITMLSGLYPTLKNVHLKTTLSETSSGMQYLHEVGQGCCDMDSGYGIVMAETCGFPDSVTAEARRFQAVLRKTYPLLISCEGVDKNAVQANVLVSNLLLLKDSSLDDSGLRSYLQTLRKSVSRGLEDFVLRKSNYTNAEGATIVATGMNTPPPSSTGQDSAARCPGVRDEATAPVAETEAVVQEPVAQSARSID